MKPDKRRWHAVGDAEHLKRQAIHRLKIEAINLLLIWHEGRFHACERACPHELADLARGRVNEGRIHCPHHRASFSLADGAVSPGWSCSGLLIYEVRIVDGHLWIDLGSAG